MTMTGAMTAARYLYAVPPVVIALCLFGWQLLARFDWLEIAFGSWAWLYWTGAVLWAGSATFAALRLKWGWLVVLTAPLAFYPAIGASALLVACASGNCL